MMVVGEIFLGALLQAVFDKLASGEMLNFFRRESIHTQVMNWRRTLLEIRAVLDDAEEKQITNKLVNLWLEELQDLAYDLDELLDEFSTEALRYKLIENSQSSTNKHLHLPKGGFQWQFGFKMLLDLFESVTIVYAESVIQVLKNFNLSWLCLEKVLVDVCL